MRYVQVKVSDEMHRGLAIAALDQKVSLQSLTLHLLTTGLEAITLKEKENDND